MDELKMIAADDLYYTPLDKPKMLIHGLLSTGLAILSGDSKIGKSWMVLWFCMQIARGDPVWGFPTEKTDVAYFALEDHEFRLQERMQMITEDPPHNVNIIFNCGILGRNLESQIEKLLDEHPGIGIIFIDTLQRVRDNVSGNTNAYAQDYRDMTRLKKIADKRGICIFLVHHNRKERSASNVFHDITGSTGIVGTADTIMVLQKEEHSDREAILSITGRDIEERTLQLEMKNNVWTLIGEVRYEDKRKAEWPSVVVKTARYFLTHGHFEGTMTDLLRDVGDTLTRPNAASKFLTEYYGSVFKPLGIAFRSKRNASGRWLELDRESTTDADYSARFMTVMAGNDGQLSLPNPSSSSSSSSLKDDEKVDDTTPNGGDNVGETDPSTILSDEDWLRENGFQPLPPGMENPFDN